MTRRMMPDGKCYRAMITYGEFNWNGQYKEETVYFGPYDTPGKAKAARTVWKGGEHRWERRIKDNGLKVLDEKVQVSDTWVDV